MNQTTKKPQDIEQEQSYLHWCQTLVTALKRLSLAAQTTGGTAGPDAELQAAIAEAERAMSPGACSAAIDKAEEAPTPLPPPIFSQAHSDAMYRAGMILAGKMPQPSAPSVSADKPDAANAGGLPREAIKAIHSAVLAIKCDPTESKERQVMFNCAIHSAAAEVARFAGHDTPTATSASVSADKEKP